jgi:PTH2 family peptidyl-tRNA hydrolase
MSDESAKYTHKQVLVLRKDLNMRKGKMVAQGSHAAMRAVLQFAHRDGQSLVIPLDERNEAWLTGRFTKVCVSVNSESALLDLYERAKAAGLYASLIQDAGFTEFGGIPTYTAVAIGPDIVSKIDDFTGGLPLL